LLPQAHRHLRAVVALPRRRGACRMPFPDLPKTEAAIVELTNAFRAENRLGAVKANATLAKAARAYAEYLARSGKFAHEADGRQPADRTLAAGYRHCIVAENLALNQQSRGFETRDLAGRAINGWKDSPPHRAAMLNPHVTEIGVGIAQASDKDPKFLSVQLFGRPESLKFTFRVENRAGAPIVYGFGEKTQTVPANAWVAHTACIPGAITVQGVTSSFKASDGAVFRVTRDGLGPLHVEMSASAGRTSSETATAGPARPR
jgi:uncharacterized protein YkwD